MSRFDPFEKHGWWKSIGLYLLGLVLFGAAVFVVVEFFDALQHSFGQ